MHTQTVNTYATCQPRNNAAKALFSGEPFSTTAATFLQVREANASFYKASTRTNTHTHQNAFDEHRATDKKVRTKHFFVNGDGWSGYKIHLPYVLR